MFDVAYSGNINIQVDRDFLWLRASSLLYAFERKKGVRGFHCYMCARMPY